MSQTQSPSSDLVLPDGTPVSEIPAPRDPREHRLFRSYDLRRYASDGTLDEDATREAQDAYLLRRQIRASSKGRPHVCTEGSNRITSSRRRQLKRLGLEIPDVAGCGKHLDANTGPNHEARRLLQRTLHLPKQAA